MLYGSQKADEATAVLGEEYFDDFAMNDFALSMVDQSKDRALLAQMFEERVTQNPKDAQQRASLAFIYYELGQIPKAITVLENAGKELPTFTKSAECFIGNLKKGAKPDVGC
jgi:regulator of sirC expression with transglutaminase-like and TPR domain